jgi:hypothetical protein
MTSFNCYLHYSYFFALLDDLWDFPIKSIVLVFKFCEAENLFLVF